MSERRGVPTRVCATSGPLPAHAWPHLCPPLARSRLMPALTCFPRAGAIQAGQERESLAGVGDGTAAAPAPNTQQAAAAARSGLQHQPPGGGPGGPALTAEQIAEVKRLRKKQEKKAAKKAKKAAKKVSPRRGQGCELVSTRGTRTRQAAGSRGPRSTHVFLPVAADAPCTPALTAAVLKLLGRLL